MKSVISITNHSETPLHVQVADAAGTVVTLGHGESFQTGECDGLEAMNAEAIIAPTAAAAETPNPPPSTKSKK